MPNFLWSGMRFRAWRNVTGRPIQNIAIGDTLMIHPGEWLVASPTQGFQRYRDLIFRAVFEPIDEEAEAELLKECP